MPNSVPSISNFRQKKKETERKLARNKDNMTRLFDITSELDRQLGPLKKQAEDAKKYLENLANTYGNS